MDGFGENGLEQRVARIERWIVAHEEWCQARHDSTIEAARRNDADHKEIKDELKEIAKFQNRVYFYLGAGVVLATLIGTLAQFIVKHIFGG